MTNEQIIERLRALLDDEEHGLAVGHDDYTSREWRRENVKRLINDLTTRETAE